VSEDPGPGRPCGGQTQTCTPRCRRSCRRARRPAGDRVAYVMIRRGAGPEWFSRKVDGPVRGALRQCQHGAGARWRPGGGKRPTVGSSRPVRADATTWAIVGAGTGEPGPGTPGGSTERRRARRSKRRRTRRGPRSGSMRSAGGRPRPRTGGVSHHSMTAYCRSPGRCPPWWCPRLHAAAGRVGAPPRAARRST